MLDVRQQYYYDAYRAVSRSRSMSMAGPLPIPVSEILSYCILFKIDNLTERERIFRFVTRLDEAYLEHVESKRKK